MSIQSVSSNSVYNSGFELESSKHPLCQKVIDASHRCWLGRISSLSSLKSELKEVSSEELVMLIREVAKEPDGKEILENLSKILPLEKLDEAIQLNALGSVKAMARDAVSYLEKVQSSRRPTLSARLGSLIDSMISVLETFLNAFGVGEFFRRPHSQSEGRDKAQLLMMLLQFSILLSTLVMPVFGAGYAGIAVASTMLGIWALSLIYPYIKRRPSALPHSENWTSQYRMCQLSVGDGRVKAVDEIANTLINTKGAKVHPLLLGESGIGKTETVKILVEAIEKGKYPELKGKTIAYINTADLMSGEIGPKALTRINEMMGRHRNDFILIFDDIHMACQGNGESPLAGRLKTLLDGGQEGFPYVIGITTRNEFYRNIFSGNSSLSRYFKKIFIDSTELNETIKILKNSLWKHGSKILVPPKGLELLVQKTQEAFGAGAIQPSTSLKILSLCIKKLSETEKSPLEKEIESVRNQIDSLYLKLGDQDEIDKLEIKLDGLLKDLKAEKEDIKLLYQDRDRLAELRKSMYQSALKLSDGWKKTEMMQFLLYDQFLVPTLEAKILETAKRFGVKTSIDAELIDEVIREEKENAEIGQTLVAKSDS